MPDTGSLISQKVSMCERSLPRRTRATPTRAGCIQGAICVRLAIAEACSFAASVGSTRHDRDLTAVCSVTGEALLHVFEACTHGAFCIRIAARRVRAASADLADEIASFTLAVASRRAADSISAAAAATFVVGGAALTQVRRVLEVGQLGAARGRLGFGRDAAASKGDAGETQEREKSGRNAGSHGFSPFAVSPFRRPPEAVA